MRSIVKKIHKKSKRTRKIILWIIISVLALILLIWWLNNIKLKLQNLNFQASQLESMSKLDFSKTKELKIDPKIKEILENIELK